MLSSGVDGNVFFFGIEHHGVGELIEVVQVVQVDQVFELDGLVVGCGEWD